MGDFVDDYLDRIGLRGADLRADAESLRRVHEAHLIHVPFENLSIARGEPIVLEPDALAAKIIGRRRGGFCYELNGLFAELLRALGFEVTLLAARVWGEHGLGAPLDHLTLRVDCPGPWLADVGFGAHSRFPLRFDSDEDQPDPGGTFRLTVAAHGDIDVTRDGDAQYRIEDHPRGLADFEGMCWWQQTSPRSHFTQNQVCTRLTGDGRVTISGDRLIRTTGEERTETVLDGEAAVTAAYRDWFGIEDLLG